MTPEHHVPAEIYRELMPSSKKLLMEPELASQYVSRFAGIVPTSRFVQEQRRFVDSFSALLAALEYFNPLSKLGGVGFSGVVYRTGKRFAFTGSVIRSGAQSIEFIPAAARNNVVAFWRTTRQQDYDARYFSDYETGISNAYQQPFYLATSSEMLKVFQPGEHTLSVDLAEKLLGVARPGYALGKLVHDHQGHIVRVSTRLRVEHLRELEECAA